MINETFVSATAAAKHLAIRRKFLLDLARGGIAGSYPVGNGQIRKRWVFKISELEAAIDPKRRVPIPEPPLCPRCRARRDIIISANQPRPLPVRRPVDKSSPRRKFDGR